VGPQGTDATRVPKRRYRRSWYRRRWRRARRSLHISTIELVLVGLATAVLVTLAIGVQHLRWPTRSRLPPALAKPGLTPAQARAINDAVPFAPGPVVSARRFIFHGTPAARLQATECLATAAVYEAGGDELDQRAVMQVVLNRLRRTGFPKTVCGVVYDGSQRQTGCQFSFTCDGSVDRRPETRGWLVARQRARQALSGYVFAAVGASTHYHTDWVVPYWSSSLAKVAKIHSHIFYRHWGAGEHQLSS
jgi:cell wall hydrolase